MYQVCPRFINSAYFYCYLTIFKSTIVRTTGKTVKRYTCFPHYRFKLLTTGPLFDKPCTCVYIDGCVCVYVSEHG